MAFDMLSIIIPPLRRSLCRLTWVDIACRCIKNLFHKACSHVATFHLFFFSEPACGEPDIVITMALRCMCMPLSICLDLSGIF